MLKRRYSKWMHDWEYRLTSRDTNRVVRPFEWGVEWLDSLGLDFGPPPADAVGLESYFVELNRYILENSDSFYGYQTPTDFRLETREIRVHGTGSNADHERDDAKYKGKFGEFLRFTSPARTPFPENDIVNARWFPAKDSKRAMVVMPQWNSDAISHCAFGNLFNLLGVSMLRLTMPYHDIRMPAELSRADYAVSSNITRTIAAARQGIIDVRCCLDWLEQQGYEEFGVLGTSLGSCYAFIASAHDKRLKVNIFNHASTYFGDVVWTGHSTRHIREGIEQVITRDRLREVWTGISPIVYFDQFERWPKKSLMIYTHYDQTFLPEFSEIIAAEFKRRHDDAQVIGLPCGHYTLGETPYKYMDAYHICSFVKRAFKTEPRMAKRVPVEVASG